MAFLRLVRQCLVGLLQSMAASAVAAPVTAEAACLPAHYVPGLCLQLTAAAYCVAYCVALSAAAFA
jgi:hypothetical protein